MRHTQQGEAGRKAIEDEDAGKVKSSASLVEERRVSSERPTHREKDLHPTEWD